MVNLSIVNHMLCASLFKNGNLATHLLSIFWASLPCYAQGFCMGFLRFNGQFAQQNPNKTNHLQQGAKTPCPTGLMGLASI